MKTSSDLPTMLKLLSKSSLLDFNLEGHQRQHFLSRPDYQTSFPSYMCSERGKEREVTISGRFGVGLG